MLGNSVVLTIVGNKIDLLSSQQLNSNELIAEAQGYCKTAQATHFCTSAKTNKGIDELFLELTKSKPAKFYPKDSNIKIQLKVPTLDDATTLESQNSISSR